MQKSDKLTFSELRKIFENHPKYPGVKKIPKQLVVNDGFPGTFNLSIAEGPWRKEFKSYLDLRPDWAYSYIQQVIRPADFDIILQDSKENSRLGIFDMGDIAGWIVRPNKEWENLWKHMIKELYNFLTETIGLEKKKIHVSCFAGCKVEEATNGKYKFNKKIEKDPMQKEWVNLGIPGKNIIQDKTRNTLLTLQMFGEPSPWGYRNEIYYDFEGKLIDIATIECLMWKPVYEKGEIIDIAPWNFCFCACGCGLERILQVKNKLKHIKECDHIFPLYNQILEDAKIKDEQKAFILTETLRVCHRVLTDSEGYNNLGEKRREKLARYIAAMHSTLLELKIPLKNIKKYIELNAKNQPFFPELNKSDFIAREIGYAFERKFSEFPAFPRAEFYEGSEGYQKIASEILKEKSITVSAIASSAILKYVPLFNELFRKKRAERKIFLRIITDRTKEALERKAKDKEEWRHIKFLDSLTQRKGSGLYLFENKFIIITSTETEEGGIIVENKEMADILKVLFENAWKLAKDE